MQRHLAWHEKLVTTHYAENTLAHGGKDLGPLHLDQLPVRNAEKPAKEKARQ